MLIPHKGHTDTIHVYSVTVMTHVKALQAGNSSQGTSEPITPVLACLYENYPFLWKWLQDWKINSEMDFSHQKTGHQGPIPLCLRWFLKTLCLFLTSCQIAKTCHKVRNIYEFPRRYAKYLAVAAGPSCMHAHNHPGKSYTRIEPEYNLYHLVPCNNE